MLIHECFNRISRPTAVVCSPLRHPVEAFNVKHAHATFCRHRFTAGTAARPSLISVVHPSIAARSVSESSVEDRELEKLAEASRKAADLGAQVVRESLDKPKNISYKGTTDLVTDVDKASEEAVLGYLLKEFPEHGLLGEEGGIQGNSESEYLWAVDPLDGTTNFSHNYPSFGVSVAVLLKGQPIAATVVEFSGGPHAWVNRTFHAALGKGAFANGQRISVSEIDNLTQSLLVTGFGYEHDVLWAQNVDFFKHFTNKTQGVRRLGAAAIDLCHVALGLAEAHFEYRLKPWDVSAGALMVRESGGVVTDMQGHPWSAFSRSILASNGLIHDDIVRVTGPETAELAKGDQLSPWFIPPGYDFIEQ